MFKYSNQFATAIASSGVRSLRCFIIHAYAIIWIDETKLGTNRTGTNHTLLEIVAIRLACFRETGNEWKIERDCTELAHDSDAIVRRAKKMIYESTLDGCVQSI